MKIVEQLSETLIIKSEVVMNYFVHCANGKSIIAMYSNCRYTTIHMAQTVMRAFYPHDNESQPFKKFEHFFSC